MSKSYNQLFDGYCDNLSRRFNIAHEHVQKQMEQQINELKRENDVASDLESDDELTIAKLSYKKIKHKLYDNI